MSENKRKAAAVAVVKTIVEETSDFPSPQAPNNWSQWGKQTIMINRNMVQSRPNQKTK